MPDGATPVEGENFSHPTGTTVVSDPMYSNGQALKFQDNLVLSTKSVTITQMSNVVVRGYATQQGGSPNLRLLVNGDLIQGKAIDSATLTDFLYEKVTLEPGTYTIGLKPVSMDTGRKIFVDVVSFPVVVPPDTTPPETTIDSGPSGTINQDSAEFTFSSSETGSTFECSLDGAAFAACTSPVAYSGLVDGQHTFQVRATDAAGNVDATPASQAFTVDTAGVIASSEPGAGGYSDIVIRKPDGSQATDITNVADPTFSASTRPSVSPDGTQVVYGAGTGYTLDLVNIDGSNLHAVATYSFLILDVEWTADGSEIMLSGSTANGKKAVGVDPSNGAVLWTWASADTSRFGPQNFSVSVGDSSKIVYGNFAAQIGVYDRTAGTQTLLANPIYPNPKPVVSPDGAKIAYNAYGPDGLTVYAWLMDSSGANAYAVHVGSDPRWSPDGQKLVVRTNTTLTTVDLSGTVINSFPFNSAASYDWGVVAL